jgi:hypothetical protein
MRALSTSKMPPQQPGRLLDLGDDVLDFGTHGSFRDQETGIGNQEEASASVYCDWSTANQSGFRNQSVS